MARTLRPALIAALAGVLAAAGLGVAGFLAGRGDDGGGGPPPRRPDIVILLWDTTRADRLSAYGYGRETTPWLASLAARGVLFEQCRAPAPWTLPSHASLFTGLLPRHHGCTDFSGPLDPSIATLAERLRDAGYDTILVSNNPVVGRATGLDRGFRATRFVEVDTPDGSRPSAAKSLDVIREELAARRGDPDRAGRPLFLFVNLMEPHLPYEPPEAIERPWRPAGVTDDQVRAARRFRNPFEMRHNLGIQPADAATLAILPGLYDAEIRDLDDHCARIEKGLEEEGILGKDIPAFLAVTADHGENLGEHGLLDHKVSTSDHLLHVPLVIRWPGHFEGGRRVTDQVRLQDLFPTVLEAAGAPIPVRHHAASLLTHPLPGRLQVSDFPAPMAFLAEMRRQIPREPAERFAVFEVGILAATGPEEGGRRLKWERRRRPGKDGTAVDVDERLYDLAADPGEDRDLLAGPAPAPADLAAAKALGATADAWVAPVRR